LTGRQYGLYSSYTLVFFYFAENRLHFAKEQSLKDFTEQSNIIDKRSFSLAQRFGSFSLEQY